MNIRLFILLTVLVYGCGVRAASIEIPDGFVGWVTLRCQARDCAHEDRNLLSTTIRVDRTGSACSGAWKGPASLSMLRFYYVDPGGRRLRELRSSGWGKGGEIWGSASRPAEHIFYFFVGPEPAFQKSRGYSS
jgi:hypothetical protein